MKRIALLLLLSVAAPAFADIALPDYERVELDNGAVLLLSEKHDVPLIGLEVVLRGGASGDPADRHGLASLFAAMLEKGSGDRDAAAFAEAVDAVGGKLVARADAESIRISADFMTRDVELLVELVTEMLRRPTLDADEMARLQGRSINLIKAAKGSNPGDLLPAYGNAFLFGEHPYGNPISGSEESLAQITHDDLLGYYENQVGGDRLIIAVVGDFNAEGMKARLSDAFGDWRAAAAELTAPPVAAKQSGRRVFLVDKPGATQTYFWLANIGVAIDYPQRAALNLANTVFGGRFTSMLMTELRVKAGLTYSANSAVSRRATPGSVVISSFTETGKTVEAIDMAIDVLQELHDSGVEEEMIVSARNYIMGQFPPRLETAAQLAAQISMLELYGLDSTYVDDYVEALNMVDEAGVAATIGDVYPLVDDLALILIGDAAQIREAVGEYGPVTEMSISEPRFRP